jgi:cyclic beta-1,2-glucan synthetase
MYRLAVESILGLRREGDTLRFAPCLPAGWKGFKLRYRFGKSVYVIDLQAGSSAPGLVIDGVAQPSVVIPLLDDGSEHRVELRLAAQPCGGGVK